VTPRTPRAFTVYGFATTHDALAAETALRAESIDVTPIPAPRELGSLCGIALRLEPAVAVAAEAAWTAAGLRWNARAEIEDV
jgi:hypothetical protein